MSPPPSRDMPTEPADSSFIESLGFQVAPSLGPETAGAVSPPAADFEQCLEKACAGVSGHRLREAAATALSRPASLAEAWREFRYIVARETDLRLFAPGTTLGPGMSARRELVERMLAGELRAVSLEDLAYRVSYLRHRHETSVSLGIEASAPILDSLRSEIERLAVPSAAMSASPPAETREHAELKTLRVQIAKMRKDQKRREAELAEEALGRAEAHRAEVSAVKATLAERERELRRAADGLRHLAGNAEALEAARTEASNLGTELEQMRERISEREQVIARLGGELGQMRERMAAAERANARLSADFDRVRKDLATAAHECEQAQVQADHAGRMQEELDRRVQDGQRLETELAKASTLLKQRAGEIVHLKSAFARKSREQVRVETELQNAREARDHAARAEASGSLRIVALETELAKAATLLKQRAAEIVQLKAAFARKNHDQDRVDTELQEVRDQAVRAEASGSLRITTLETELAKAATLLKQRAAEIVQLKAAFARKSHDQDRVDTELLEVRDQAVRAEASGSLRITALETELAKAATLLKQRAAEIVHLKSASARKSRDHERLETELQEARQTVRIATLADAEQVARIAGMEAGLAAAAMVLKQRDAEKVRYKAMLARESRERDRLEEELRNAGAPRARREDEAVRAESAPAPSSAKLRRTNFEKREAVLAYLVDPDKSGWSNREIARLAGVSPQTVGNLRARLAIQNGQTEATIRRVSRGGREYVMQTAGIATTRKATHFRLNRKPPAPEHFPPDADGTEGAESPFPSPTHRARPS